MSCSENVVVGVECAVANEKAGEGQAWDDDTSLAESFTSPPSDAALPSESVRQVAAATAALAVAEAAAAATQSACREIGVTAVSAMNSELGQLVFLARRAAAAAVGASIAATVAMESAFSAALAKGVEKGDIATCQALASAGTQSSRVCWQTEAGSTTIGRQRRQFDSGAPKGPISSPLPPSEPPQPASLLSSSALCEPQQAVKTSQLAVPHCAVLGLPSTEQPLSALEQHLQEVARCPNSHEMQRMVAHDEGWYCNHCSTVVQSQSGFWRCRFCGWDMCDACRRCSKDAGDTMFAVAVPHDASADVCAASCGRLPSKGGFTVKIGGGATSVRGGSCVSCSSGCAGDGDVGAGVGVGFVAISCGDDTADVLGNLAANHGGNLQSSCGVQPSSTFGGRPVSGSSGGGNIVDGSAVETRIAGLRESDDASPKKHPQRLKSLLASVSLPQDPAPLFGVVPCTTSVSSEIGQGCAGFASSSGVHSPSCSVDLESHEQLQSESSQSDAASPNSQPLIVKNAVRQFSDETSNSQHALGLDSRQPWSRALPRMRRASTLSLSSVSRKRQQFRNLTKSGLVIDEAVDLPAFKLLPVWEKCKENSKENRKLVRGKPLDSATGSFAQFTQSDDEEEETPQQTGCAITPNWPGRVCWDLVSIVLVIWDLVMIPLQLFDQPMGIVEVLMGSFTRIFWTFDIVLAFFTGFMTADGSIELRLKLIGLRYLKTWLILDVALVCVDWMEAFSGGSAGMVGWARISKTSRSFRIVRMLRLLRIVRIREIVKLFTERLQSERSAILVDIASIVIIVMGYSHLIACVWWGIGSREQEQGDSWVINHGFSSHTFGYKYSTSLHWSLSLFAGGMDEITPHNTKERVFLICAFMSAFMMASMIVSSLTSSMTKLHIITSGQSQKMALLRKYLSQNNINHKLSMRIWRNAHHALEQRQRFVIEDAVELVKVISEPLCIELHFEMYGRILQAHPFFERYVEYCPQVMRKVCHRAMSIVHVSCDDVIFEAGEAPSEPKMYFVGFGTLCYCNINGYTAYVREREWIAEATLWCCWRHLGRMTATQDCRLFVIDATIFQDIASQFDHVDFDPRLYAEAFVADLNDSNREISDLGITSDPIDDLEEDEMPVSKTNQWLTNRVLWTKRSGKRAVRCGR